MLRPLIWAGVFVLVGCARMGESEDLALPGGGAAVTGPCANERLELQRYLATLPSSCATDADCAGLHIAANTCAPPVVLAKSYDPTKDERLAALREAVIRCEPVRACEAVRAYPACSSGRCTDARPDVPR